MSFINPASGLHPVSSSLRAIALVREISVKPRERREKRWFIRWLAPSVAHRKIFTGGTATGQ
jgi:intein-encoded DNA endonuclease-like protein